MLKAVMSAASWVRDFGGGLMTAAGGIVLALGAGRPVLLVIGCLVTLAGVVASSHKISAYRKLEEERSRATGLAVARAQSLHRILENALRMVMAALSQVDFSRARLSIYRHDKGEFFLLVRVSQSQDLQRAGRPRYPDGEGVIHDIWDRGLSSVIKLPEDRQEWEDDCARKFRMSPESVRGLHMQSRSFVGIRLDANIAGDKPVGVLVLESLSPLGVNGKTADRPSTEVVSRVDEHLALDSLAPVAITGSPSGTLCPVWPACRGHNLPLGEVIVCCCAVLPRRDEDRWRGAGGDQPGCRPELSTAGRCQEGCRHQGHRRWGRSTR
jgi:hypothetical protein